MKTVLSVSDHNVFQYFRFAKYKKLIRKNKLCFSGYRYDFNCYHDYHSDLYMYVCKCIIFIARLKHHMDCFAETEKIHLHLSCIFVIVFLPVLHSLVHLSSGLKIIQIFQDVL